MMMMTTTISSSRSMKTTNLSELIENFHRSIEFLRHEHENEIEHFRQRIEQIENENRILRTNSDQQSIIDDLKSQLESTRNQVKILEQKLEEQSDAADVREKFGLRTILDQQQSTKFDEIQKQFQQFDQCHFETDEQIRLLKQCLFNTNSIEQSTNISQSLTVKQSDLIQQTNIVENLLRKHEEKILQRLNELIEGNSSSSSLSKKTKKKKRL